MITRLYLPNCWEWRSRAVFAYDTCLKLFVSLTLSFPHTPCWCALVVFRAHLSMDLLQKSGKIFWKRKHKQNLDSSTLTSPVIRNILIAFHKRAKANCNHGCCQHFVFQLAMNSGLFLQSKDGCIEANVHSLQKAKLSTCWKAHVKSVQLTGKMLVLSKRVKWWTAPKPRKANREADRTPNRVTLNRLITPMVWTVFQWMRIAASFLKAQVLSYQTSHQWSRLHKFLQNEEPELPFRDNWKAYQ